MGFIVLIIPALEPKKNPQVVMTYFPLVVVQRVYPEKQHIIRYISLKTESKSNNFRLKKF